MVTPAPKAIIELVERDINSKGLEDKLRVENKNKELNENIVQSTPSWYCNHFRS